MPKSGDFRTASARIWPWRKRKGRLNRVKSMTCWRASMGRTLLRLHFVQEEENYFVLAEGEAGSSEKHCSTR